MTNQETMDTQTANRMCVATLGDFVEALYGEVMPLPISDQAKHAMVMVMVADCLTSIAGGGISFTLPPPETMTTN